jgi:hypothetical protein
VKYVDPACELFVVAGDTGFVVGSVSVFVEILVNGSDLGSEFV